MAFAFRNGGRIPGALLVVPILMDRDAGLRWREYLGDYASSLIVGIFDDSRAASGLRTFFPTTVLAMRRRGDRGSFLGGPFGREPMQPPGSIFFPGVDDPHLRDRMALAARENFQD